ncbi:HSP20-like chaperone [Xylaria sp. CBS 124048]|nr:HSP20-like chaperone [Xylaria sp. CBS 124048]
MSVFAHHPFYTIPNSDYGNFGGLVRFIDDWDKHFSRQSGRSGQPARNARRSTPTFTPRFDVRETEQSYELHGELPGIEKKDVNIEFSDAQTIVIRGNIERTYTEGNAPAGMLEDSAMGGMSGAIGDKPTGDDLETSSNKSFQPTVEEDYEDVRSAGHSAPAAEASSKPTESGEATKSENTGAVQQQQQQQQQEQQQQQKPKSKYWIYERSVGNFSRSFTFSSRVDHDNVEASLNNGILKVVVPKAKPESRRIAIH